MVSRMASKGMGSMIIGADCMKMSGPCLLYDMAMRFSSSCEVHVSASGSRGGCGVEGEAAGPIRMCVWYGTDQAVARVYCLQGAKDW
jgi:hypothetical protein